SFPTLSIASVKISLALESWALGIPHSWVFVVPAGHGIIAYRDRAWKPGAPHAWRTFSPNQARIPAERDLPAAAITAGPDLHSPPMTTRRPFIGGNWKMNTDRAGASALVRGVIDGLVGLQGVDVAVFPPFPYLLTIGSILRERGSAIRLGAQDA